MTMVNNLDKRMNDMMLEMTRRQEDKAVLSRRLCQHCKEVDSPTCRHCFVCGVENYQARDCPKKVNRNRSWRRDIQ